jgi:hypothetical protein
MGACCAGTTPNIGEEYIDKVLNSKFFYLKNLNISQIKNTLDNIPVDNFNDEVIIRKNIYPIIFEESDKNKRTNIHKEIISEIISNILSNEINEFLLYFFPFCLKENSNNNNDSNNNNNESKINVDEKNLFKIFLIQSKSDNNYINNETFYEILDIYLHNVTILLTFSMWNVVNSNELKTIYDEENSYIFTNENKNFFIEKIKENFNEDINEEKFIQICNLYDLTNYRNIRNYFISMFGIK